MLQDPQDSMNTDDSIEETQQATQSTQHSNSQSAGDEELNSFLWGYLQPCNDVLRRIDFFKIQPNITIGRHNENAIILPGAKVSNRHCRITWDGREDSQSSVVLVDLSSNGTFLNGNRIGKDKKAVLRDGYEIAFGTAIAQPGSIEDYRFVFRFTAVPSVRGGVHMHYDITCEIGKGSFATVVKGLSRASGQWYAIKMISPTKARRVTANDKSDEDIANPLMREIAILQALDHPNICKLKEVFMEDGRIDLVLEFIEGGDLLDFIVQSNGLGEPMSIHIMRQLCDALTYIHSKGIAHRDLKPENVLLTLDKPPNIKVADFGLAKVVDSCTFLKTMCGTPSYLAPEVVMQTQHGPGYSDMVDSWSAGVIAFSMLTCSNPFLEDENQRDMKLRIANRTIDWKILHNYQVSDLAFDFIRSLLEFDPNIRLSLSSARFHPWLGQHAPVSDGIEDADRMHDMSSFSSFSGSSLSSLPDDDEASMSITPVSEPSVSNGLEMLQLGQQNGSSRLPLQRCNHPDNAENDVELPGPSWQMLDAAGATGTRTGKRKLNEYGSQSVNATVDEMNVSPNKGGARKRGKQAAMGGTDTSTPSDTDEQEEVIVPTPKRGGGAGRGRGRGRGAQIKARLQEAAGDMVVEEDHVDDDTMPPARPRRSQRTVPANKGRK